MKQICVPINKEAMNRLDTDSCIAGDLIEWQLTQIEFETLNDTGIFSLLNKELELFIDEYEDELIEIKKIDIAIETIKKFQEKNEFLKEKTGFILNLFEQAKLYQTGVFFFF